LHIEGKLLKNRSPRVKIQLPDALALSALVSL